MILSEPSNPYRAGVASLYTQEFYRAVRDRLKPDGVFVQWVQAYEVDGFTVNTVLATARSVFDHVEIWQTIPGDLQMVCSQQPIEYSEAGAARADRGAGDAGGAANCLEVARFGRAFWLVIWEPPSSSTRSLQGATSTSRTRTIAIFWNTASRRRWG